MNPFIRKNVRDLSAYTPGEQPADPAVIKLNTNENPYPPSPGVRDILGRMDPAALRLYPDPVCMKLRTIVAGLHHCAVEQIFVGNGSDEVLALCLRAFVEQDGTVGYFDPSYSLYPVLAAIQDVETRPVPLTDGFEWNMPDGYQASLFFVTRPNAPTGMSYPRPVVEHFAADFPGMVVVDEAYADFASDDCMDLALACRNVLVCRTLSKAYSLAGIRLGYVVGDAEWIGALYKIKDSYNVSRLAQDIASAAMSDQEHMRGNVRRIRRTRDRVSAELTRRGCTVCPSEANFLWVKPAGASAGEWSRYLREANILVRYFDAPRIRDYLRITIGTDAQMDALLDAWARFSH